MTPGRGLRPRRRAGLAWVAALWLVSVLPAAAQPNAIRLGDPLTPQQVVVVYNIAEPAARELALYYAKVRHVPLSNLCPVNLPLGDNLAREVYDAELAPIVRGFVRQRMADGVRVRCLVSVYGLPLRVLGPQVQPEWPARSRAVEGLRKASLAELTADLRLFEAVADLKTPLPTTRPAVTAVDDVPAEKWPAWLQRYQRAVQGAQQRLGGERDVATRTVADQLCVQALQRAQGLGRMVQNLRPRDPSDPQAAEQLAHLTHRLTISREEVDKLLSDPPTADSRVQLYRQLRDLMGYVGVVEQTYADQLALSGQQQSASLEGELALLLWPRDYPLARWVPNVLAVGCPPQPPGRLARTTLMAVRLDGPSPALVRQRLDDSLAVEATGLAGTLYVDARGLPPTDPFGLMDDDLRRLARFAQASSTVKVVLDDKPELFAPGSCPDAALYCGWYSLTNYVDAFTWTRGAVGYHVASLEAVAVRGPGNRWVQQMLGRGVAATLGAVEEPFLASFPPPSQFFGLLLTGRLSLAEVYFATTPMLSWQQTLFGDPLYRPFAAKPAVRWEDLVKAWPQAARLATPPASAPATQPAGVVARPATQ